MHFDYFCLSIQVARFFSSALGETIRKPLVGKAGEKELGVRLIPPSSYDENPLEFLTDSSWQILQLPFDGDNSKFVNPHFRGDSVWEKLKFSNMNA